MNRFAQFGPCEHGDSCDSIDPKETMEASAQLQLCATIARINRELNPGMAPYSWRTRKLRPLILPLVRRCKALPATLCSTAT